MVRKAVLPTSEIEKTLTTVPRAGQLLSTSFQPASQPLSVSGSMLDMVTHAREIRRLIQSASLDSQESDFYLELELDSELGESTAKGLNQITSGIKKLVDNSMEGVLPENFSPGMESGNYGEERLTRVMEEIQFDGTLLRNGILLKATEFELAKQFDDTLAEDKGSHSKGSLNQTELENPKQIGENKGTTSGLASLAAPPELGVPSQQGKNSTSDMGHLQHACRDKQALWKLTKISLSSDTGSMCTLEGFSGSMGSLEGYSPPLLSPGPNG